MRKLLLILLICFPGLVFSQECLNLDFEYGIQGTLIPLKWRIINTAYQIVLDTTEKISLERSLRITSDNPTKNQFGGYASSFPVELVRGKNIELKGKIKTKALVNGYVGFMVAGGWRERRVGL